MNNGLRIPGTYSKSFALLTLQFPIMKLTLLSCEAQRPDRRAISRCITEIASNIDESSSNELTDILLDGDAVDIEIEDKNTSSAFRALRKLSIDYEILE